MNKDDEYYKMLAFMYEFSNGFRFTEKELEFYRERFYKYFEIKKKEDIK